jgi:hypothetical protein
VGGEEVVLAETQQQVGLAHSTVTDYQQLHQVIIALLSFHYY